MQISDREIRESLRLLAEQPIGSKKRTEIDQEISRMVLMSLQKVPDIRSDRVMPLRMAVRERRYDVPGEKVASQLLGRCFADHLR
jgi:anti-sigma28 factor (negative regulator of flagellin synthesis)